MMRDDLALPCQQVDGHPHAEQAAGSCDQPLLGSRHGLPLKLISPAASSKAYACRVN
jgi:hypothetical protein